MITLAVDCMGGDHGPSVTLAVETVLVRRYLDIEEYRFGERLRVEWSLDPNAGQVRLPRMLLQSLAGHAAKHLSLIRI